MPFGILDQRLLRGVEVDLVVDGPAGALVPAVGEFRRPDGGVDEVVGPALAARPEPGDEVLALGLQRILGHDDGVVVDGEAEVVEEEGDRFLARLLDRVGHVGGEIERGVDLALDQRRRVVLVGNDLHLVLVDVVELQHRLDRDDVDRRHRKRLADEVGRRLDRVLGEADDADRVLLVLGADDLELRALVDDRRDRRVGRGQRQVGLAGDERAFRDDVRAARAGR